MPTVDDCRLIEIATFRDRRGDLSVAEAERDLGFLIRRVYWLHGTPAHARRAGHAHRALSQCYIAVAGSLTVTLDDGRRKRQVRLDRPDQGLLIGPGIWRDLDGFSGGAVMMVLASETYDEADYIRKRTDFLAEYGHGGR